MAKTSTKEPKKVTKKEKTTKVAKAPVVNENKETTPEVEEIKIEPIELEDIKFDDNVKTEEVVVEQTPAPKEEEVKTEEKPKSKLNMVRQYFTNFWNGMAMDD